MGFLAFAVLLPEASEAGGSAKFPGFRVLALGYGNGLLEAGCGFSLLVRRLLEEECAFEAIEC